MKQLTKICMVCGREFQWRKKWQNSWHQVQYCSRACRQAGLTNVDIKLEKVIMDILQLGKTVTNICPSQAAKKLAGEDDERGWRNLMEPTRRAARRLAHQGKICITQGGKVVDPSRFKGPIRLKLKS